jgi:ABC-type glycerol-3-phosphate transport system substrate-binding protein
MTTSNPIHRGSRRLTRREALKLAGLGVGATAAGSILAACAPAATQAPTVIPATAAPPTAAAVTLRYQQHWSKETDAHHEGMKWLFSSFAAKYPNITIKDVLIPDSGEMRTKTLADCAAGDCPEIIHEAGLDMWEAGYLTDLTPHIEADAAWKSLLVDSTLFRADGKVWGICAEAVVLPTIWNTRILDAAGVSAVPKTWDELLAACEKIKSAGKLPTSWGVGGTHAWHNIVASQAGGLEALAANDFDAPVILDTFQRMKVFVDNKWVPDNEIELTWQQSIAQFVAEDTAFFLDGAWTIGNNITGAGAAPDLKDKVVYAPFPSVGENGTTVELKKGTPVGLSKAAGDNPAMLDAGLKFLKHYFSAEAAKQWILLTKSPMGVNVDLSTISGVDPLLLAFLDAQTQADFVYGLPETLAMQERGWDDSWSGLQALLAGKSAEEAVQAMVTEMSKYAG